MLVDYADRYLGIIHLYLLYIFINLRNWYFLPTCRLVERTTFVKLYIVILRLLSVIMFPLKIEPPPSWNRFVENKWFKIWRSYSYLLYIFCTNPQLLADGVEILFMKIWIRWLCNCKSLKSLLQLSSASSVSFSCSEWPHRFAEFLHSRPQCSCHTVKC